MRVSLEDLVLLAKEQLSMGREVSFTITGNSMWPFLCHRRDKVVLESINKNKIKKGDIILFQVSEGNYVLHRITKKIGDLYITTGDGNTWRDGVVSPNQVVARVSMMVRKGKKIRCDNIWWRMIIRLWMAAFPIRKYLLRMLVLISS
ncbi:MAG: S26 family signal peptidase [Anaerostipes sp.]|nr:S26 family signal peptidase [Anaerostipes sp.]